MLRRLLRRERELTADERHAQSLREIPLEQFPEGPARRAAIQRALAGEFIQGYRPAYLPDHVLQFYEPEGRGFYRMTPEEWAAREGYALTDGEAR